MSHILSFDQPLGRSEYLPIGLNWRVVIALVLNVGAWIGLSLFVLRLAGR